MALFAAVGTADPTSKKVYDKVMVLTSLDNFGET